MMIVSNYQETRRMADFYAPRGRSCCPVGWEVVSSIIIEIVWVWGRKRPILREKLPYCETNCSVPSRLKPEKLLPVIIFFIWNVRHQWSSICIFSWKFQIHFTFYSSPCFHTEVMGLLSECLKTKELHQLQQKISCFYSNDFVPYFTRGCKDLQAKVEFYNSISVNAWTIL